MNNNSSISNSTLENISRKRLTWIDVVKGLAIFLVVLGHFSYSKDGGAVKQAIYSFHMPLFFMVAGCTAAISFGNSSSVSAFFVKRVISVFVPYTVWCFLYRVPFTDISQLTQTYSFAEHLHCFLCGTVMEWFLICLFVLQTVFAIYKFITKIQSSTIAKLATAGGLFVLLFVMHRTWGRTSADAPYWALEFLTNAYKFYIPFAIGVFIIEYPTLFKKLFQNRFALSIYIFAFLFGIMIDNVSAHCRQTLIGSGISLLIIHLLSSIDYSNVQKRILQTTINQLKLFGKYTLAIYLFHGIFLPWNPLATNVWGVGTLPFLIMFSIAVVTCYICIVLDYIISLSPFWSVLLLGKKSGFSNRGCPSQAS